MNYNKTYQPSNTIHVTHKHTICLHFCWQCFAFFSRVFYIWLVSLYLKNNFQTFKPQIQFEKRNLLNLDAKSNEGAFIDNVTACGVLRKAACLSLPFSCVFIAVCAHTQFHHTFFVSLCFCPKTSSSNSLGALYKTIQPNRDTCSTQSDRWCFRNKQQPRSRKNISIRPKTTSSL